MTQPPKADGLDALKRFVDPDERDFKQGAACGWNDCIDHLAQRGMLQGAPEVTGETSDGYHTFNELYEHRHALFMALAKAHPERAWKSWEHDDGSLMEGWFIAGIETPRGQATYHLPARLWDSFKADYRHRAPKWDGHTSADVIVRIGSLPAAPKMEGVE